MGMGRGASGLPFFPAIFKTENQQVAALTGVICAAGTLYYIAFNLSGALRTSPARHTRGCARLRSPILR